MKTILFALIFMSLGMMTIAQEAATTTPEEVPAAAIKNDGNAALVAKDYAKALELYEKYMATGDSAAIVDVNTIFNMAECARKLKNDDKAIQFYQKSEEMGNNADICSYYIASSYKSKNDIPKMKEVLLAAISKYPNSKFLPNIKKLMVTQLKIEASEPFNKANELSKAASLADPKEYVAKMGKAVAKYKETIPYFEEVLKYGATDEVALRAIEDCKLQIKTYDEYVAKLNAPKQ